MFSLRDLGEIWGIRRFLNLTPWVRRVKATKKRLYSKDRRRDFGNPKEMTGQLKSIEN
jgi:hypothetical protein